MSLVGVWGESSGRSYRGSTTVVTAEAVVKTDPTALDIELDPLVRAERELEQRSLDELCVGG